MKKVIFILVVLSIGLLSSAQEFVGLTNYAVTQKVKLLVANGSIQVDTMFHKGTKLILNYTYYDANNFAHKLRKHLYFAEGVVWQEATSYPATTFWETRLRDELIIKNPKPLATNVFLQSILKAVAEIYYMGDGVYLWVNPNYEAEQLNIFYSNRAYFEFAGYRKHVNY